ncbi:MAG: AAA family ATPase [Ferroplasma sp.]
MTEINSESIVEEKSPVKWRLTGFRITNFRSIVDSGYVNINSHTTVLIGSNRAGKSSLLNALAKLNYDETYDKFDLTQIGNTSFDYMNKKILGSNIKMIEAEFLPIKKNAEDEKLIVSKFYDSTYHIKVGNKEYTANCNYEINKEILHLIDTISQIKDNNTKSDLEPHIREIKDILNQEYIDYNKIFMILDIIKNIGDRELESRIDKILKGGINGIADVPSILKEIPKFIYFSAYDRLENKVTVTELIKNPDSHKTFVNLLKLAQIDLNVLISADVDQRISYLEKASNIISSRLSNIWGSHEGRLEIRYEEGNVPLLLIMVTPQESRDYLVPPGMESDGFQWFMSVFINLNSKAEKEFNDSVLMLDDLGVLLHPGKQANFLDFLRGSLPANIYLIYTTHLPFFIPLDLPGSIMLLSKNDKSTDVTDLLNLEKGWKTQNDVLAPVNAALGYGILDSYFINKTVFFVSSIADQIILNFIWDKYNIIKNNIKNIDVAFIGNNKNIYSYALWSRYNNLPFYVILNDNSEGKNIKEKLAKMDIDESHVKLIPSKIGVEDSTVEDFIDPDIVAKAYVKHHRIYSDSKLSELTALLKNKKGTLRILKKFSEENNISFDREGMANEITSILKTSNSDVLIVNLYNIIFPFIVEEDYSFHEPVSTANTSSEKPVKARENKEGKKLFTRLFSRVAKNAKKTNILPDRREYDFNFESESKIMSIAISNGNALLTGDRNTRKKVLSKLMKYGNNNNRHIVLLATSREKDLIEQLNIDDNSIEVLSLSPAYFRQRLVTDVGQAMTLAGKLYVEIKNNIKDLDNSLIIIYKVDDVIPVHKKENSLIYQNEFWRVFFQFINSMNHQQLLLLTGDNESYSENLSMYVNTIIRPNIINNFIDISVEKSSI